MRSFSHSSRRARLAIVGIAAALVIISVVLFLTRGGDDGIRAASTTVSQPTPTTQAGVPPSTSVAGSATSITTTTSRPFTTSLAQESVVEAKHGSVQSGDINWRDFYVEYSKSEDYREHLLLESAPWIYVEGPLNGVSLLDSPVNVGHGGEYEGLEVRIGDGEASGSVSLVVLAWSAPGYDALESEGRGVDAWKTFSAQLRSIQSQVEAARGIRFVANFVSDTGQYGSYDFSYEYTGGYHKLFTIDQFLEQVELID